MIPLLRLVNWKIVLVGVVVILDDVCCIGKATVDGGATERSNNTIAKEATAVVLGNVVISFQSEYILKNHDGGKEFPRL